MDGSQFIGGLIKTTATLFTGASLFFNSFFGETLRITLPSEPPTLDWNIATDNVSYQILNQLMEGLTQFDENLNVIPAMASSWEVLDEGKTYIFHINQKAKWSDGVPVKAQDFRYSWLRLLNPQTAAEYAYFLFDVIGAEDFNSGALKDESQVGIEAPNDGTLIVRLTKPIAFFPSITTFMVTFPMRKDIVEKFGDSWTEPKNMVTCGLYLLQEWWHEYRLHLLRNVYYGGSPWPSVKDIFIYLVADPSTALSLYETGYLDIVSPPPLALSHYQKSPDLIQSTKLRGYYLGFNVDEKPFDDASLRRALAMALDKSKIPGILKGGEIPTNSWIPQGMPGANEDIGLKFDSVGARELLGMTPPPNPLPHRGGGTPRITLTFNSDPTNKKIAEWAAHEWKTNLGIDVELENREWKEYLSLMKTDPPGLFRLGWGADYPDPDNFMNLFTSFSGNNHTNFKNEEYDSLISQAAGESDMNKRLQLYDEAQKILLEKEAVIIPLFIPRNNILVKEKFRPFPLLPMDFIYYKRVGQ